MSTKNVLPPIFSHFRGGNRKFVIDLIATSKKHSVELFFSKSRWVKISDKIRSNGYFSDHDKPRLAIACGQPLDKWFALLVHESSHLDQWLEHSEYWQYISSKVDNNSYLIDEWLAGAHQNRTKKVFQEIDKLILLEADCEIRSIQKIKKYGLAIDSDLYCQRANAYIYFYHHLKTTGQWYRINFEPYSLEQIYSQMPKKMFKNARSYLRYPKKIERIFNLAYKK